MVHSDNPEKILFSQILNNKWNTLHKLWRYEEAIEAYDMVLKLNPQDAQAYYNKWSALHKLWRYEEAIEAYDMALDLNPQHAIAYNNKGITLRRIWEHEIARLYIFVSEKLKWENPWYWSENIEAKRELDALLEQKNFEGVRQYLKKFEERKPNIISLFLSLFRRNNHR